MTARGEREYQQRGDHERVNVQFIKHNLSLEKLSNKLELLGVTLYPNDIYLIEKEQRIVKDFELVALCSVLDIDYNTEIKPIIEQVFSR